MATVPVFTIFYDGLRPLCAREMTQYRKCALGDKSVVFRYGNFARVHPWLPRLMRDCGTDSCPAPALFERRRASTDYSFQPLR